MATTIQPGMRSGKKSWHSKLRPEMEAKIGEDPRGAGRMLIPGPMHVAAAIRKVRKGRVLTVSMLRARLAADFGADVTCPMVTGIFLNIIAGAAGEDIAAGRKPLAPWWRIVQDDGSLNPKRPGGAAVQAQLLREEGHAVTAAGAKLVVQDFRA